MKVRFKAGRIFPTRPLWFSIWGWRFAEFYNITGSAAFGRWRALQLHVCNVRFELQIERETKVKKDKWLEKQCKKALLEARKK